MGRGFTKMIKSAEMQGALKQIPPDAAQAMGQTNTLLGNIVKASGVATPVVQPVASLQFDNEERAKRIQDSLGRAAFGPERIKEILMQLKGLSFLADGGRVGYQAGGVATPEQYAAALQKVGGGTETDKQRSLGNYLGDYIATQGQKLGNAAIIPLQAAKGILGIQGTPMTSSMQSALQNIIQNQIKNTGQLSGNINYKDYGVQTSTGAEFEGFGNRSITDPEAALATTLGRASYTVDPTTGKVNFTGGTAYDFRDDQFGGLGKFISKGGAFGSKPTEYKPEISLQSEFLKPSQQPSQQLSQQPSIPYEQYVLRTQGVPVSEEVYNASNILAPGGDLTAAGFTSDQEFQKARDELANQMMAKNTLADGPTNYMPLNYFLDILQHPNILKELNSGTFNPSGLPDYSKYVRPDESYINRFNLPVEGTTGGSYWDAETLYKEYLKQTPFTNLTATEGSFANGGSVDNTMGMASLFTRRI
jgi:hypothetical protein